MARQEARFPGGPGLYCVMDQADASFPCVQRFTECDGGALFQSSLEFRLCLFPFLCIQVWPGILLRDLLLIFRWP